MAFNVSYISNMSKSEMLINGIFTVEQAGYHFFGNTIGRGTQEIADCSKFKSISLMIDSDVASFGKAYLVFYSSLGKTNGFPFVFSGQTTDEKAIKVIELEANYIEGKYSKQYLSSEYDFLNTLGVGVALFIESPKVGSKINVKLIGEM